jgi:hypothetical protein
MLLDRSEWLSRDNLSVWDTGGRRLTLIVAGDVAQYLGFASMTISQQARLLCTADDKDWQTKGPGAGEPPGLLDFVGRIDDLARAPILYS